MPLYPFLFDHDTPDDRLYWRHADPEDFQQVRRFRCSDGACGYEDCSRCRVRQEPLPENDDL